MRWELSPALRIPIRELYSLPVPRQLWSVVCEIRVPFSRRERVWQVRTLLRSVQRAGQLDLHNGLLLPVPQLQKCGIVEALVFVLPGGQNRSSQRFGLISLQYLSHVLH